MLHVFSASFLVLLACLRIGTFAAAAAFRVFCVRLPALRVCVIILICFKWTVRCRLWPNRSK